MSADQVTFGFARPARVQLRELNGFDEQFVDSLSSRTAIGLLERLLIRPTGSASERLEVLHLTASERDRLLAQVYEQTFGPRIESTARCSFCKEQFDLTFEIGELLAAYNTAESSAESRAQLEPDGTYTLPGVVRFRLPTGEDEIAVMGMPPEQAELALLHNCIITAEKGIDPDVVQQAMEDVAPVLDLDLDAQCPECGAKQQVHFDVQFYLLRALQQQSKQLAREVHRLAVAYGWSLNEIMNLPRTQRRNFVELVESDLSARVKTSA